MPKRLTSYVSDGIARSSPLEGGPAYEAMMRGGGLIKDTWGGYLSRLLEYYEGQLSPEDAMSLLGLSSEMIHDPKVQMSGEYEYGDYEEGLRLLYESEAYEIFRPESIRLLTLFNTICEPWLVTDEEKDRQAELLEALIAHNEADIDHEGVSDDEWESYMKREVELRSREASVGSGISIPAAELAAAMLSATPVQPDTMSELWRT